MKLVCAILVALGSLFCLSAVAAETDFDMLRQNIESQHLRSVEQVLMTLSPTLRYRYVLVFSSRSLQEASYEAPRVILFSADASTIITFNGDPSQRGFNALELMTFDDRSGRFEFREITFPAQGEASDTATFSEPNPPRCQSCHGVTPRPVWDSWPLWPGVYGERYGTVLSSRERAGLETFLARQASDARYRHLLGVERWSDPETFRPSSRAQYAATAPEPPNAQLGALLSALMGRALAHQLQQQPAMQAYRYAMLGLSDERCGVLADFLPNVNWSTLRPAWRAFTHEVTLAQGIQSQAKVRRLIDPMRVDGSPQQSAAPEFVGLGFLAQQAFGMGPSMWTTALEPGSYDLPRPAAQSLRAALLAQVESDDQQLSKLSAVAAASESDRYCAYLQRHSRAAIGTAAESSRAAAAVGIAPVIAATHIESASPQPARLLQLCASCHESGVGPPIPFTDPESLARELRTRTATHGTLLGEVLFRLSPAAGGARMPLGITLSDVERSQLQLYFSQLTNFVSPP